MLPCNLNPDETVEIINSIESDFINSMGNKNDIHILPFVRNILFTHLRFKYPYQLPFVSSNHSTSKVEVLLPSRLSSRNNIKKRNIISLISHNSNPNRLYHFQELERRLQSYSKSLIFEKATFSSISDTRHPKAHINCEYVDIGSSFSRFNDLLYKAHKTTLNVSAIEAMLCNPMRIFLHNCIYPYITSLKPRLVVYDNFVESQSMATSIVCKSLRISCCEIVHGSVFDSRYPLQYQGFTSLTNPQNFICLEGYSPSWAESLNKTYLDKYESKKTRFLNIPDIECNSGYKIESNIPKKSSKPELGIVFGGGFNINSNTPISLIDELEFLCNILLNIRSLIAHYNISLLPHPRKDIEKELPEPIYKLIKNNELLASTIKQGQEASNTHKKLDAVIITFGTSFWKKTLPYKDVKTIFITTNLFTRWMSRKAPNAFIVHNLNELMNALDIQ